MLLPLLFFWSVLEASDETDFLCPQKDQQMRELHGLQFSHVYESKNQMHMFFKQKFGTVVCCKNKVDICQPTSPIHKVRIQIVPSPPSPPPHFISLLENSITIYV